VELLESSFKQRLGKNQPGVGKFLSNARDPGLLTNFRTGSSVQTLAPLFVNLFPTVGKSPR
jgi:hypothetical protein